MPLYEDKCDKCDKVFEYYSPLATTATKACPSCGGKTGRIFSVYKPVIFQEYTTTNIRPDGQPVTIKSAGQESSLCREYGVCKADDVHAPSYQGPQIRRN